MVNFCLSVCALFNTSIFRDQIAQLDQEMRELQKELDLAGSKQNYQKVKNESTWNLDSVQYSPLFTNVINHYLFIDSG